MTKIRLRQPGRVGKMNIFLFYRIFINIFFRSFEVVGAEVVKCYTPLHQIQLSK